jgi:endonuclease/exonuclease/phosphatase family metal-dependent hydrolase
MTRTFREALWRVAGEAPAWPDAIRLQELAFALLRVGSDHRVVVLAHPATLLTQEIRPGDVLIRSALHDNARYSAIVVSTQPERRAALSSRGVPVESDTDGWYVEVAEVPREGGAPRSVGRLLTDAWGRVPRGQMLLRASKTRRGERPERTEQAEDVPVGKSVTKLKVMTWNIRLGIESSLKEVGEAVRVAGVPDLLALQEIGVDWNMGEKVDEPRVLAKQIGLPHHLFVGALTDKTGGRFGIALLSSWPFVSADVTMLPLEKDEQRVLLRARVGAPTPFTVLTTHLARDSRDRLKQAAIVGATAAAAEGPVVLLGDFNDSPASATLKSIKGTLVDCFESAGKGPGETFSVKAPKERIDYILCGAGFEPGGPAQVVRTTTASDHFPVTAIVGLKTPVTPAPSKRTGADPFWRTDSGIRPRMVSPPPR